MVINKYNIKLVSREKKGSIKTYKNAYLNISHKDLSLYYNALDMIKYEQKTIDK